MVRHISTAARHTPTTKTFRDDPGVRGLLASTRATATLSDPERTDVLGVHLVSGNYFDVLGLRPSRGRFFRAMKARPARTRSWSSATTRGDADSAPIPPSSAVSFELNGHP